MFRLVRAKKARYSDLADGYFIFEHDGKYVPIPEAEYTATIANFERNIPSSEEDDYQDYFNAVDRGQGARALARTRDLEAGESASVATTLPGQQLPVQAEPRPRSDAQVATNHPHNTPAVTSNPQSRSSEALVSTPVAGPGAQPSTDSNTAVAPPIQDETQNRLLTGIEAMITACGALSRRLEDSSRVEKTLSDIYDVMETSDDADDEAASDVEVSAPRYREDSFLALQPLDHTDAGGVRQTPTRVTGAVVKRNVRANNPVPSDHNVCAEVPRIVTADVIQRITDKTDLQTQKKILEAERQILCSRLAECTARFRIAGDNLEMFDPILSEQTEIIEDLKLTKQALKSVNVRITELSACTAEEKKLAQKAAASRAKQRKTEVTHQVAAAISSAPAPQRVDDAEEESAVTKTAPSTATPTAVAGPKPRKRTKKSKPPTDKS